MVGLDVSNCNKILVFIPPRGMYKTNKTRTCGIVTSLDFGRRQYQFYVRLGMEWVPFWKQYCYISAVLYLRSNNNFWVSYNSNRFGYGSCTRLPSIIRTQKPAEVNCYKSWIYNFWPKTFFFVFLRVSKYYSQFIVSLKKLYRKKNGEVNLYIQVPKPF